MTVSETPAGTESPLQIRSGDETGSAGTTGPSEPPAALQRSVWDHLLHGVCWCNTDNGAIMTADGEAGFDQDGLVGPILEVLDALGINPDDPIDHISARLAVSDDDLAALERLTDEFMLFIDIPKDAFGEYDPEVDVDSWYGGQRALLAHLKGTQP